MAQENILTPAFKAKPVAISKDDVVRQRGKIKRFKTVKMKTVVYRWLPLLFASMMELDK